jgi:hypothetical protein
MRLYLTGIISLSGTLLVLMTYRYSKSISRKKASVILMGWILSNMFSAVPLMYSGLPYFARPVVFTFISFVPIGALFYDSLNINSFSITLFKSVKTKQIMKSILIVIFVIVPAFLIPIIKYAPLPFLYPTTRELSTIEFTSFYLTEADVTLLELTTPWGYSSICGYNQTNYHLIGGNLFSNGSMNLRVAETTLILTYRLVARDAFYDYEKPRIEVVENITRTFLDTHNKIFDSGWPYWILMPKSELVE